MLYLISRSIVLTKSARGDTIFALGVAFFLYQVKVRGSCTRLSTIRIFSRPYGVSDRFRKRRPVGVGRIDIGALSSKVLRHSSDSCRQYVYQLGLFAFTREGLY